MVYKINFHTSHIFHSWESSLYKVYNKKDVIKTKIPLFLHFHVYCFVCIFMSELHVLYTGDLTVVQKTIIEQIRIFPETNKK